MLLRTAAKALLAMALGLPIVQAVLIWVGGLLKSMGDEQGAAIVHHVGTATQVVWTVSIVTLVIVLALVVLDERPQDAE